MANSKRPLEESYAGQNTPQIAKAAKTAHVQGAETENQPQDVVQHIASYIPYTRGHHPSLDVLDPNRQTTPYIAPRYPSPAWRAPDLLPQASQPRHMPYESLTAQSYPRPAERNRPAWPSAPTNLGGRLPPGGPNGPLSGLYEVLRQQQDRWQSPIATLPQPPSVWQDPDRESDGLKSKPSVINETLVQDIREAMQKKDGEVFVTVLIGNDERWVGSHLVSVNHSFEGAVDAARNTANDQGWDDDCCIENASDTSNRINDKFISKHAGLGNDVVILDFPDDEVYEDYGGVIRINLEKIKQ